MPAGLELTILDTLSVGCRITCAQPTELSIRTHRGKATANGWRIIGFVA